jgi:hypothetical protein
MVTLVAEAALVAAEVPPPATVEMLPLRSILRIVLDGMFEEPKGKILLMKYRFPALSSVIAPGPTSAWRAGPLSPVFPIVPVPDDAVGGDFADAGIVREVEVAGGIGEDLVLADGCEDGGTAVA